MEMIEVEDYQEMSRVASQFIIEKVQLLDNPVLGLATGSTPEGVYKQLIEKRKQGNVSFANTSTFNLDEYVGLDGDDPNSYRYYMNEKLFSHIDIPGENTRVPNGMKKDLEQECGQYEQLIKEKQGIDLQMLGIGLNGHIGFNEPGTSLQTRTHVVELAQSTRKANARFFDSLEEVPEQAITMGIETIMASREIILLVSGERKAEALDRLLNGPVTEDFPASILQTHPNVKIIADRAARSLMKK
ncbi:glucosamine-6-phosphate deaminase [Sediminibacillus massiliensis]|uniref:glucosamine-6-phosphate deaminase n=1 Tax=Sediminibacillus massiliensis TaxID=1926277 RepID=UPI0009883FE6|nr:glucosamine-6-phosphate deaminase [Sediminibacillus massiliensis]